METRQEELRGRLGALGFDEVRFAKLSPVNVESGLRRWLDAGYQADMAWMERTADKRLNPELVLSGARSAVLLGISYYAARPPVESVGSEQGPAWARYSLYQDYHDSVKSALEQAGRLIEIIYGAGPCDYRYYVDTGPVLERAWAALSGMGFVGKNSMLISRVHGNWLFLASILTRLELEADPPTAGRGDPGGIGRLCGKCTRCMDACPTQAFPQAGVVDARRCISYQTIENKGTIPIEFRAPIGNRIYGCDTCLEVCPWNRFARDGRQMLLSARGDIAQIPLGELLGFTAERFAETFRGSPIKRIKLIGLLRNACVAAGNSGEQALTAPLLRLARHDSPLVRAHAVWALRRLGASECLNEARIGEQDPSVLAEYETIVEVCSSCLPSEP